MNNPFSYKTYKRQIIGSVIAVFIMCVAAVFLFNIHGYSTPYGAPWDIGSAAFFPGLIALLLAVLGIFSLISQWQKIDKTAQAKPVVNKSSYKIVISYCFITLITLALPWLGIWLTAMIIVPALSLCFGERRWKMLLLLSVLPPFIIIHLFEDVMGIYFPTGVFF